MVAGVVEHFGGGGGQGPPRYTPGPLEVATKMTEAQHRPGPMAVLALLLLGAAAYVVPQLFQQPGFVDYVDAPLREGSVAGTASLVDIFAGRVGDAYAPVAWLSFQFDHAIVGDTAELAGVMHLHSALLHLCVSVILLVLLCRLRVESLRAMFGAVGRQHCAPCWPSVRFPPSRLRYPSLATLSDGGANVAARRRRSDWVCPRP